MQYITKTINPLPLLLIYSLLPGISKLLDSRIIFLANVPIILFAIAKSRFEPSVPTIVAGLYFCFSLAQTAVLVFAGAANVLAALTSTYMYLLPVLGIYTASLWDTEKFMSSIVVIAIVHALIGILLYNIIPLPGVLADAAFKLKDGVFQFRMASVSGSIAFGVLMTCGLMCSCYLERKTGKSAYLFASLLLYVCVILSQQRSAWGVSTLFLGWHVLRDIKSVAKVGAAGVLLFFALNSMLGDQSPELGEFFGQRIAATLGQDGGQSESIVSERSHMWANAWGVFNKNLLGIGIGQGGLVANVQEVNQEIVVTDGDYFHILLESGLYGIACYALIIGMIYRIFLTRHAPMKMKYVAWVPVGATLQMVGSNLTELYFTNFLLWVFIGLACKEYSNCMTERISGRIGVQLRPI